MDIIFNELSLIEIPPNEELAKEGMNKLLQCLKNIQTLYRKKNINLKTIESIKYAKICQNDYSVLQWLSNLDKTDKQYFLAFTNKGQFIHNYPFYEFNSTDCKGFGYAYDNNLLTLSYDPDVKWKEDSYHITKKYIEEENDQYIEEIVQVKHLGSNELSSENIKFINGVIETETKFINLNIKSGVELEYKLSEYFPYLIFTNLSRECITSLNFNFDQLKSIYSLLLELNKFSFNWDGIPVRYNEQFSVKTSPESETREKKFSQTLITLCPDGKNREFTWHQRFTPDAGRLYFYPDVNEHKIYIGYIGKKLT